MQLFLNVFLPFLDDFEEASQIKETRRNIKPPVYNPRRLSEKPLPLLVLVNERDSSGVEEDGNDAATSANNEESIDVTLDPLMELNLLDETNNGDNSLLDEVLSIDGHNTVCFHAFQLKLCFVTKLFLFFFFVLLGANFTSSCR